MMLLTGYAGSKNDTARPDTYTLEKPGQWQVGLKVYKGDFFKVTIKDNMRNGATSPWSILYS